MPEQEGFKVQLPPRLWAVFVAGDVIAMFVNVDEANAYMRVLRGPESTLSLVAWSNPLTALPPPDDLRRR